MRISPEQAGPEQADELRRMRELIKKNLDSNDPSLVHAAALLEIAYQLANIRLVLQNRH